MKLRQIIIILAILNFALPSGYCEEIEVSKEIDITVSASKDTVRQYELFEAQGTLSGSFVNPFDYDEVALTGEITFPDGKVMTIPAFYTGSESIWKVRFAPPKVGMYLYRLTLKYKSETYHSDYNHFDVRNGKSDGFLRKDAANSFYPAFDSGKPFFGIGHNIGWVTNKTVSVYERYFSLFKENGLNLTRIWINSPWTFCIETKVSCCFYDSRDCEKLDSVIKLAEEYGVYIILVLDTYGALMEEGGIWQEQFWKDNPYNKANGGPCEKPWDFFTNEKAKGYYKNRLRYIVARWSYSPNIIAFELWNEIDAPADWVTEISSYMKSINPHSQFITTSLGYPWGNNFDEASIWHLDGIDIIQRHLFGNQARDITENMISVNREVAKTFNKPFLVAEFGMDANKNDVEIDAAGRGVALHNSLWACALTKSFSAALNWWWGEYIRAKNLYPHYKALKNFVEGIKWNSPRIEFLKTSPIKYADGAQDLAYSNVTISTYDLWGNTDYKEFEIHNNGDCLGGLINTYLHGNLKKEFKLDPAFRVNYPADGKLILRIGMVSQGARLIINLDGQEVLNMDLPAGPGQGPWKRSSYRKDVNIYQCVYDKDVEIAVPKGEHIIQLSNAGNDWIGIRNITLTNYMTSEFANARVIGLLVDDRMLFWIQNKLYNWKGIKKGIEPSTIKGAYFKVIGVENGIYDIEWWDTHEGRITSRDKTSAEDNELKIFIPNFSMDLACKLIRRAEGR